MDASTSPAAMPCVSFVVPCYNSSAYMDRCLESLLIGASDVEVIIVDDGSTRDDTAAKADAWADRYPGIVKVIHQTNKGHGGAVMAGLSAATGEYLIVVDSDDWLDRGALETLLDKLRTLVTSEQPVDLVVTNYVYEHAALNRSKVVRFRGAMPQNRVFRWADVGFFGPGQNLMIHATVFRTQVLRDCGLQLPEHTFYVDNIFVYVPLPYVKTLYYLPVNLYRYYIGREDQSVNQRVLVRQLDQQMRVTDFMVDAVKLPDDVPEPRHAKFMREVLGAIVAASSGIAVSAGTPEALAMRAAMWAHLHAVDPALAKLIRRQPLVFATNLPGRAGQAFTAAGYRFAHWVYPFN